MTQGRSRSNSKVEVEVENRVIPLNDGQNGGGINGAVGLRFAKSPSRKLASLGRDGVCGKLR